MIQVPTGINFDSLLKDALVEAKKRLNRQSGLKQIWRFPYQFYGGNLQMFNCDDFSPILIVGPAECGKTIATCCLLHLMCLENPGIRCAMIRKEYASLWSTIVRTFEDKVLPESRISYYNNQYITTTPYGGAHPSAYMYSNGSMIFLYGMDKSAKRLGGELDLALYNQAEQATIDDIETLVTRTTGRSGKIKTRCSQLILDANPGGTTHFLLQMIREGSIRRFDATHEDNPVLYNHDLSEWTEQGKSTLSKLDKLTGVRYLRLRKGVWAGAEASIFPEFDPRIHGIDSVEVQLDWKLILTLDVGFNHRNAFLLHAVSGDGIIYTLWELTHRFHFVNEIANDLKIKLETSGFSLSRVTDIRAGGDAFAHVGSSQDSIAEQYAKEGIYLYRGEVGPGSRFGKTVYFQELLGVSERQIPPRWFYVIKECPLLATQIPAMIPDPNSPDTMKKLDIDANGEGGDDCVDSLLLIWSPSQSSMA